MKSVLVFFVFLAIVGAGACAKKDSPTPNTPPNAGDPLELPEPPGPPKDFPPNYTLPTHPISWEDAGVPERRQWSRYVSLLIMKELLPKFDKATDTNRYCETYKDLQPQEKATLWTEIIAGVAYYESSWNPTASRIEAGDIDQVTGKPGRSEGLMQMDYQARLWYPYCRFDWEKDKNKGLDDPTRTILNPYINLECGARVLAHQIDKRGVLNPETGGFWSTLRAGTNAAKYIRDRANELEFCHAEGTDEPDRTEQAAARPLPPTNVDRGQRNETYIDENGNDVPKNPR
jgi:hypothetical protein